MGVALERFRESIQLARALKTIERQKYGSTVRENQSYVKGLRGGSAVLMVASFEFFLRLLFEQNMAKLNTSPPSIDFRKLPDKLRVKIFFDTLEYAMRGPKYGTVTKKVDRINDIIAACKLLITDHINPSTFGDTSSNPNSNTVKKKFQDIGIEDVFGEIKLEFERKWRSPVAATFIEGKLDEIINERHVVAHTADTLNITKSFQNEALRFLTILAELLEKKMESQVKSLLIIARK